MDLEPNAVFLSDCLTLLERVQPGRAALIYLDPPFFSKDSSSAGRSGHVTLDGYLSFISSVLRHSIRILSERGNLFFHSEPRTAGRVRPLLDEVFGIENFRNEIIWPRTRSRVFATGTPRSEHDSIFHFSKSESFVYNPQYRAITGSDERSQAVERDERGTFFLVDLTSPVRRERLEFEWQGYRPPPGRSWRYVKERLDALADEGRIVFRRTPDRLPVLKNYVGEESRIEVGSIWDDVPPDYAARGEFSYPAQKPTELLERVVLMGSEDGDMIVDPFCGSGTALLVAHQTGRKWLGCDSSPEAHSLTVRRLEKVLGLSAGGDFLTGDESLLKSDFQAYVSTGPEERKDSRELSARFRHAIENKFPYPVARPFYQLRAITDRLAEIPQLANIVGVAVQHLAVVTLAEYLSGESRDPELSGKLLEIFKKPLSHGVWAGVLRDVLNFRLKAGGQAYVTELPESYFHGRGVNEPASLQTMINELIQTRNELIKKSADELPPPERYGHFKRQLVGFLQAISFLKDYPLISVESSRTSGDVKTHDSYLLMGFHDPFEKVKVQCDLDVERMRMTMLNLRTHELLYLYPFYKLAQCPEGGCGKSHLFRFEKLDRTRVEYVAAGGHKLKDEGAGSDLVALLQGPWGVRLRSKSRYLTFEGSESRQQLPTGYRVDGRYEVLAHLRQGGMADVYEVADAGEGRKRLALKLLPFRYLSDRAMVQRFRQEATQARTFTHPNITRVLAYGESFEDHYLVMELADGWAAGGGRRALDVGELPKPVNLPAALSVVKQVCEGLDYIHGRGVVHRDVKPANLLLFGDAQVKLSDFGIARSLESLTLTLTGLTMGTPEYMSPEQAEGKRELSFASDIYSLGIVLFELLTGQTPFKRATPLATALAHIREAPPPAKLLNPEIPEDLNSIIKRCLNKTPESRFKSARELYQALEAVESAGGGGGDGPGDPEPALIRFDGLYKNKRGGRDSHYLRFFEDGEVIEVLSTDKPDEVARWFDRDGARKSGLAAGRYSAQGDSIEFFTQDSERRSEYKGSIDGDMLELRVTVPSLGYKDYRGYRFVQTSAGQSGNDHGGDEAAVEVIEPALLIRINRNYRQGMSAEALYDATRGVWRVGLRRGWALYAMAVYHGVVREVYAIERWLPAGTGPYATANIEDMRVLGRWEFTGRVASDDVRDKYYGHSVAHYFKQGQQNPVVYVNCPQTSPTDTGSEEEREAFRRAIGAWEAERARREEERLATGSVAPARPIGSLGQEAHVGPLAEKFGVRPRQTDVKRRRSHIPLRGHVEEAVNVYDLILKSGEVLRNTHLGGRLTRPAQLALRLYEEGLVAQAEIGDNPAGNDEADRLYSRLADPYTVEEVKAYLGGKA